MNGEIQNHRVGDAKEERETPYRFERKKRDLEREKKRRKKFKDTTVY